MVAIVVATILNGSSFWLKRVGWLEPELYRTYESITRKEQYIPRKSDIFKTLTVNAYQTKGVWKAFKASKDVVFLSFFLISFLFILRGEAGWKMRYGWMFVSMAFLLLYAFFVSYFQAGILLPMAGLRSFLFMGVAIGGAWAVREGPFPFLAKCLVGLVLFQVLLAPFECTYGMRLFMSGRIWNRIVGTMLQPSSFGIVLVLGMVWCFTYCHTRKWMWWLVAIVYILVLFSGSATAILLLFFVSAAALCSKMNRQYRKWLLFTCIAGGVVLFFLLPEITGRATIYDSPLGRLLIYKEHIFEGLDWRELLFGRGLGAGTNTAANLFMDWQADTGHGAGDRIVFVADSTPLMLIAQIGIIGLFLVYGVLFLAICVDQQARIFYLSIMLASLTVNITELFPVNFILGLLLAHSLSIEKNKDCKI